MMQQDLRNGIRRREMLYLGAGLVVASAEPPLLSKSEVYGAAIKRFQQHLPTPPTLAQVRRDDTGDYYEITQRESEVEILLFADENLGI
jgi:hypothetical protein